MTGLDTNVRVRYGMQNDAKQSARATEWVEALTGDSPGCGPLTFDRGAAKQCGMTLISAGRHGVQPSVSVSRNATMSFTSAADIAGTPPGTRL